MPDSDIPEQPDGDVNADRNDDIDSQDRVDDAPEADDEESFDPRAKAALAKARREALNLRTSLRKHMKETKPLLDRLKEIEDKDKSAVERQAAEVAELQAKVTEFQVREVRNAAAAKAGLPASMAQFITATDPDEAEEQAKALLEFRKGGAAVDFKQGARTTAPQKLTGDQLIRRMAGRQ